MTAGPQPRRAVIDAAWREIGPGLELLSSPDGGPLSRAEKRIIDPLVLRLRAHPEYSAPVVAADITPVCPTMSGFAKLRIITSYLPLSMRFTASSATSNALISGLRS